MTTTFPDEFNLANYYLFDRLGEGLGDKVAIRYGERTWTYAQVADRTRAVTAELAATTGIAPEQRVYIVLPDTPPFAWVFFATLANGSIVTMGNPASPIEDLAYVLDYVRASVLVTLPSIADALAPHLEKNRHISAVWLAPDTATGEDPEADADLPASLDGDVFEVRSLSRVVDEGQPGIDPMPTHRDDMAIWLFTSGSTGRPKAAMHTHRDFAFNTEVYAKQTVGYRRDDVTVSVPRLYFGYATGTNLMFPFAVGATTALFSERPTPEALAHAIEWYRPTVVTNVPTMLGKLLEYDDARVAEGKARLDMSCVRFHLSAGEALPPSLLSRFTERFENDVYDGIGSAEMFHIYASNRPGDIEPGSLGKVVDGYEVKILPQDAVGPGAEEVPSGEIGVLWVKGDSVALGYFQDRDKSWQTFHGHWCRTGDLFRKDEQGYVWFAGRADDLFKSGGIWVSPIEVEECLLQHDAVAMCAVIPAERDGLQKPKAFVVLRESARGGAGEGLVEALQEHVKTRLSKHKYPRWVVFVDDLPKNDRGKVDRKLLKAREARGDSPG